MSYSSMVMESVNRYSELKIINTNKLYKENFKEMPESTFYKVISRLAKSGDIARLAKGIYYKPRKGKFGTVASNENNILEYLLGVNENMGIVINYKLFAKYYLTTQIPKTIEVYSSVTSQEKRRIGNILVHRANIKFNSTIKNMIELLEILQEYKNIEDLNKKNLIKFLEAATEYYNEKAVKKVLSTIGYKKSTIASLKSVLKFYGVENSLNQYLNGTSRYNAINMKELYESAV